MEFREIDVYKRQVLDPGGHAEIIVGGNLVGNIWHSHHPGKVLSVGQLAVFFLLIAHREGFDVLHGLGDFFDHVAGIHAAGEKAVSYTHLDVYKRQILVSIAGSVPIVKTFETVEGLQ